MSQPEYRGADAFVERPFALEEILAAVRSAATPEERHDDDATIAQIAAVVRSHRLPVHRPVERRLASSGRRISTRLAAAMVVTVLTAGSSLALTGELPRAAREAASGFLARVGLPAPSVRIVAQGRFTPPHTTGQAFGPTGSAGSGRVVIEPDDFVSASNVPAVVVQHDGSAPSGGSTAPPTEQAPSGDGSASPTVSPHDDTNGSGGNAGPNGNGNEGNGNGNAGNNANEGNGNGNAGNNANEGNGNGNAGNGNGGQGDEPATPIDPPGSGEPATDAGSIEDPDEAGPPPDGDEAPPEDETPPVQPPDGGPAPDPRPPADPPGNGQPPTEPGPPSEPPGSAPVDPGPPADAGPPEEGGPPEAAGLPEGLDLPDQATLATARRATDPTA